MSAHLSPDMLWEAARTPPEGDDYAHLQLCPDCRLELDNIKLAQSALLEPPPPPPLSDDSARRIGAVLRKAAETQARRAQWYGAWWPFNFSPTWAFAPAAAALLAFFAYRLTSQPGFEVVPAPMAKNEVAPTPPPSLEAPRPLPVKKVLASVKRTKAAKSGSGALKKSQQLGEGSTVATAKGGELLMGLPDGSQIGLGEASQVQLAKLEDKSVTLDVARGSLKVVARHDTTRELRVRAGDLEVFDVGTEFIVSRDAERTLVGVEEGEVEVRSASGEIVPLEAGQAVEYRDGKLQRQQWASADELPKPRPPSPVKHERVAAASKKPLIEDTPDIPAEAPKAAPPAPAPAEEQPKPAETVALADEPKTASSPDEWVNPENLKDAPVHQPPPVPAPEGPPAPPAPPEQQPEVAAPGLPAPPSDEEQDVSFLARLQRARDKIHGAFKPATRLERADAISKLADQHRCTDVVSQADSWLTESVPRGESFHLRRSVLQSKLRCLNYLGRTGDASAVQRELDKL